MTDAPRGRFRLAAFFQTFGLLIIFMVVVAARVVLAPDAFARPANLMGILQQASINGVLAMGMLFVIISGGIDLSVGSIVVFTGVIAASLAHPGQHALIVAILAPVLVGGLIGMFNGLSVAQGGIPAFIVTLASMVMVRGAALILGHGEPVSNVSKGFEAISGGFVGHSVPYLVLYFAAITAVSAMLLRLTLFGRRVYATGGNAIAAAVSGISVNGIRIAVYTLSGLLAGFAGVLLASRTMPGSPTAGEGYEMNAIAAVIIGGASLNGGVGTWYGTVIGALLIAVIGNGLDRLNVSSYYQLIIMGLVLYVAVLIDVKGRGPRR
jgi:ribose/xylose/arabinose/galactoside ABC-type transport system permease subunit